MDRRNMGYRTVTATVKRIDGDNILQVRVRRACRDETAIILRTAADPEGTAESIGAKVGGRVLCQRRVNDPYLRIERVIS
jgi:hypothetical protein